MYWDLYLNTELNKNNTNIHILYNICINKYGKSRYGKNYIIEIKNNKNQINLIENMSADTIEETLSEFGCSPDEVECFVNIAKFKTAHTYNVKFIIHDYYYEDAKLTLDHILAGSETSLTDIQKKILKNELKHEITYDEYLNLPKSEQEIYVQDAPDYKGIHDTTAFLIKFITTYQNSITDIDMNIYVPTTGENPAACLQIDVRHFEDFGYGISDEYLVKINKTYKRDKYMEWCNVDGVPITELHEEFNDTFSNFDENRFVSHLTHGVFNIHNIYDNLIITCIFKQNESLTKKINRLREIAVNAILNDDPIFPLTKAEIKLINEPVELKSTLEDAPEDYELVETYTKKFKPEFLNKINAPQAKIVNTKDIIYLLNYIKHCI